MAKQSISTLKTWFETGDKPTQSQFWDWMDSYYHLDATIPQASIQDLVATLNGLATTTQLNNVSAQVTPQVVSLNAAGSVAIPANTLVDKIVVVSATAQSVTIETSVNTANVVSADPISAGGNRVYAIDLWSGSGLTLYFRTFTNPITIYLFKRG